MKPNCIRVRIPGLGRFVIGREPREGSAIITAGMLFDTHLYAIHRDFRGNVMGMRDLGSGLVTNVGVASMSNDPFWSASLNLATLTLAKWHATGTGATAAAATNYKLQTVSAQGGQTPVSATQSIDSTSTMAVPKLKSVATISYSGTEAVTEWGLFATNTLSATTGTPFTSVTATSFTATGTPFTASTGGVQGLQGQIVETTSVDTVMGLIASNTTSVGTLWNNGTTGWWTQAAQTAGATPTGTDAYALRPVMWDHKVFSAINVNSGDSIQFTYTLTINSGG